MKAIVSELPQFIGQLCSGVSAVPIVIALACNPATDDEQHDGAEDGDEDDRCPPAREAQIMEAFACGAEDGPGGKECECAQDAAKDDPRGKPGRIRPIILRIDTIEHGIDHAHHSQIHTQILPALVTTMRAKQMFHEHCLAIIRLKVNLW